MFTSRDSADSGDTFTQHYRRWNFQHATAIIVLVTITEFVEPRFPIIGLLAVWMIFSMVRLARLRTISTGGSYWANILTAIRSVAAILLLIGLSFTLAGRTFESFFSQNGRWWIVGLLLLVETTDFFDGRVARRSSIGSFGPVWDMETDAAFAIALALVNRYMFSVGPQVLIIGLMRYFYVLLWRHERAPIPKPRIQILYSKTTAAVLVIAMIVVLAPPVGSRLREITLLIVLGMQIVSTY